MAVRKTEQIITPSRSFFDSLVFYPHFCKFSADLRSQLYGLGLEKGRAIADSAFSSVIFSVTKRYLGRVTIFPDSEDFLIVL